MPETPAAVRVALEWFTSLRTELQELGLTEVEPEYGQHLALVTAALDAGARAGENNDGSNPLEDAAQHVVDAVNLSAMWVPSAVFAAVEIMAALLPPAAPERGPGA